MHYRKAHSLLHGRGFIQEYMLLFLAWRPASLRIIPVLLTAPVGTRMARGGGGRGVLGAGMIDWPV